MSDTERTVIPSRLLFNPDPKERMPYVPSFSTSEDGILARWLYERSELNPNNYPEQST